MEFWYLYMWLIGVAKGERNMVGSSIAHAKPALRALIFSLTDLWTWWWVRENWLAHSIKHHNTCTYLQFIERFDVRFPVLLPSIDLSFTTSATLSLSFSSSLFKFEAFCVVYFTFIYLFYVNSFFHLGFFPCRLVEIWVLLMQGLYETKNKAFS